MAINPEEIDVTTVDKLDDLTLALGNFFAHTNLNGKLGKADFAELAAFLAPFITAIGGSGFVATTGTVLPAASNGKYTIVGPGTYTQTTGGNIVTTELLNILGSSATTWSLVKAIPLPNTIAFKTDLQYRGTFDSTALAIAGVTLAQRKLGDTVGIKENGKIVEYWWDETTTDAGLILKDSKFPSYSFGPTQPVVGTVNASIISYIFDKPLKKGTAKYLLTYSNGNGTVKVKRWKKTATDFIFQNEVSLPVVAGLNRVPISGMSIEEGDYIGFYSTVSIRSVAGAGAYGYYSKTGDINTDTTISSMSLGNSVQIQFGLTLDIEDWYTEVASNSAIINALLVPFTFGEPSPTIGTISSATGLTYIFKQDLPEGAKLKSIKIYSSGAGSLKIKRISESNSVYNYSQEVTIQTVIGLNVIDIPTEMVFQDGDLIGLYSSNAGVLRHATAGSVYSPFVYYTGDLTGSTSTVVASTTQRMQVFFEFLAVPNSGGVTLPTVTGRIMLNEGFTENTMPTTMEMVGSAWTFANRRALPSAIGLANGLQGLIGTNFDETVTRVDFILTSTSSRLAVYNRITTFSQSGTIADVDIATNKVSLYASWNGSNTLPAINVDKVLSFTLTQNRWYRLEIFHTRKDLDIVVTDMVSGVTDSLTKIGGTVQNSICGYAFGKPGVALLAGTAEVDKIQYFAEGAESPLLLMEGDSLTEGYGLLAGDTYSYRIKDAIGGNAYISAQSSCTPTDVLERLEIELNVFKPKYVHVLIGTNSTDMTVWSTSIDSIHSYIVSKGSIPIIGCLPANAQNTAQVSAWNANLLAKGYRTIRYDLATTVNNDGVTIDLSLLQADQRHQNALGGLAMFNRAKLDAPELFL